MSPIDDDGDQKLEQPLLDACQKEPVGSTRPNFYILSSIPQASKKVRRLGSLFWVSKETVQFLNSGSVYHVGDLIEVFHRGVFHTLPPSILPLGPTAGVGKLDEEDDQHYKVVCLTGTREPGCPFFIRWSLYSSKNKVWEEQKPLEAGWKKVRTDNMIISNDLQTIYLASDHGDGDPSYIISINIMEQTCTFLPMHPDKQLYPYEKWLDSDEFAISKCGLTQTYTDLWMIRYSNSSKIFSCWILPYNGESWIKFYQVWTVESSFNWPGPVQCFVLSRGLGIFVMVTQDGDLFTYCINKKLFTKLDQPKYSYVFQED